MILSNMRITSAAMDYKQRTGYLNFRRLGWTRIGQLTSSNCTAIAVASARLCACNFARILLT
jgi:hypothetical protein